MTTTHSLWYIRFVIGSNHLNGYRDKAVFELSALSKIAYWYTVENIITVKIKVACLCMVLLSDVTAFLTAISINKTLNKNLLTLLQ